MSLSIQSTTSNPTMYGAYLSPDTTRKAQLSIDNSTWDHPPIPRRVVADQRWQASDDGGVEQERDDQGGCVPAEGPEGGTALPPPAPCPKIIITPQ